MQQPKEERSLGELFTDLAQDLNTLVRQELQLAKTEMTQKVSQVGKNVASLVIGGTVAYAGVLVLLAAIVLILHELVNLPLWLSALIVALVVVGIGYFLIQRGLTALKQEDLTPRQTIETLKEDAEWAKQQTK
jgi:hypothetical protein